MQPDYHMVSLNMHHVLWQGLHLQICRGALVALAVSLTSAHLVCTCASRLVICTPPLPRFNLLREDSEGYAKLLAFLNTASDASSKNAQDLASVRSELQAMIGYFDLDPNRVLDLLLDAYAQHPGNDIYLRAVSLLNAPAVGQLLGFKFSQYQVHMEPPAHGKLATHAGTVCMAGSQHHCGLVSPPAPRHRAFHHHHYY